MDRHTLQIGIAIVSTSCVLTTAVGAQTPRDEAAVRARIGAMESALNGRDADNYAAQYSLEADLVTPFSTSVGRDAIRDEIDNMFGAMPANVRNLLSVSSIRFLGADVALAEVDVAPTGTRATYVLHRESGEWLIAAGRLMPSAGPPPQ